MAKPKAGSSSSKHRKSKNKHDKTEQNYRGQGR